MPAKKKATCNTNYAWSLHIVSKLSENGVAGFCKKVINAFPNRTEMAA